MENNLKLFTIAIITLLCTSCCKICFDQNEDIYCGVVTMQAYDKLETKSTYGAITLYKEPSSQFQAIPGVLYSYEENPKIKLRDTVRFKVKYNDAISFAYQINETDGCEDLGPVQYKAFKKITRIDFHNSSAHTNDQTHVRGHIDTRLERDVLIPGFNQNFDKVKIEVENESEIKTYLIPSSFNPLGCTPVDTFSFTREGIFYDTQETIQIILEIGCTHEELH